MSVVKAATFQAVLVSAVTGVGTVDSTNLSLVTNSLNAFLADFVAANILDVKVATFPIAYNGRNGGATVFLFTVVYLG